MCCSDQDSFREKCTNKINSFYFVSPLAFIPNGYNFCSICNRIDGYTHSGREKDRDREHMGERRTTNCCRTVIVNWCAQSDLVQFWYKNE